MKVELEFNTNINDKSKILAKIAQVVKVANELGFNLEEVELESDEGEKIDPTKASELSKVIK